MDISAAVVPKPAHRYRLPALLQDIRLLDLLEISGTTLEAGRVCGLSQPTVSRRSRLLADDFNLQVSRRRQRGCRYGTSTAMRLLRLGCRAHRLSAGVARLGADVILQPLLAGCSWLLPAPPRFRPPDG
jgi:DNA-binding transcriptional LysR family regulator